MELAQKLSEKFLENVNNALTGFSWVQSEVNTKYWDIIFHTITARIRVYKLMKKARKLGMVLKDCPGTCNQFKKLFISAIPEIQNILEKERQILKKIKPMNFPNFVVKMHEDMIADFEDLLENFSITVDDEIRDLVSTISAKMP